MKLGTLGTLQHSNFNEASILRNSYYMPSTSTRNDGYKHVSNADSTDITAHIAG